MPHMPDSAHETHELELVAAFASGDATGPDLDLASQLVSTCEDCAALHRDLRLIAALLHVMKNVERMGDQCVNIAKLIPVAGQEPPADDLEPGVPRVDFRVGERHVAGVVAADQGERRRYAPLRALAAVDDSQLDLQDVEDVNHSSVVVPYGARKSWRDDVVRDCQRLTGSLRE